MEEKDYSQNWLSDSVTISKTSGAVVKRRSGRNLIIEPTTASWTVLDRDSFGYYQQLPPTALWQDAQKLDGPLSSVDRQRLLLHLFHCGLIRVNGRPYYPSDMFKPQSEYPQYLCLHLTEACNFACKYCMNDSLPNKARMSQETAELIITKCLRELPDKYLTIDYHGGEPLLAWDLLIHTVRFAKELNEREHLGKQLSFVFQSNGSLLTPEMVKTLLEEKVVMGISIDGPQQIHDRFRVYPNGTGTFDTVVEKIEMARQLGLVVGLLGVIHDPDDYVKSFHFFVDTLHRGRFRLNYSSYIGRSVTNLDFPLDRGRDFAKGWLEMVKVAYQWACEHDKFLDICDVNNQINNLVTKRRPFMCYRSPCGAGNSVYGFAIDGGIHACEEMASSGLHRFGSVYDEGLRLDTLTKTCSEYLNLQKRTVDNIPRCRRCAFRRFCFGGCTSKTSVMFGDYMRESPMCAYYQMVFEELMWMLDEHPDMVRRLGGPSLKDARLLTFKPSRR